MAAGAGVRPPNHGQMAPQQMQMQMQMHQQHMPAAMNVGAGGVANPMMGHMAGQWYIARDHHLFAPSHTRARLLFLCLSHERAHPVLSCVLAQVWHTRRIMHTRRQRAWARRRMPPLAWLRKQGRRTESTTPPCMHISRWPSMHRSMHRSIGADHARRLITPYCDLTFGHPQWPLFMVITTGCFTSAVCWLVGSVYAPGSSEHRRRRTSRAHAGSASPRGCRLRPCGYNS